jgi:hypothetical protein
MDVRALGTEHEDCVPCHVRTYNRAESNTDQEGRLLLASAQLDSVAATISMICDGGLFSVRDG